jgi:hypothetical protein
MPEPVHPSFLGRLESFIRFFSLLGGCPGQLVEPIQVPKGVTEVSLESVRIGSGQHAAERNVESAFDRCRVGHRFIVALTWCRSVPRSSALGALRWCTYIARLQPASRSEHC